METVKSAVSQTQNQTPAAEKATFLLASGHAIVPDVDRDGRHSS